MSEPRFFLVWQRYGKSAAIRLPYGYAVSPQPQATQCKVAVPREWLQCRGLRAARARPCGRERLDHQRRRRLVRCLRLGLSRR